MGINYKVLGQSAPLINSTANIYVVPALTQTVVSTLTVCNRTQSQISWRLAIRPGGAALSNEHYIVYDLVSDPNELVAFTLGITLGPADVVTAIVAAPAGLTFNLFGSEFT